jgi:hypothetical protein
MICVLALALCFGGSPALRHAEAIAERRWHPPCRTVTIDLGAPPGGDLVGAVTALAPECRVVLRRQTSVWLCTVLVHEFGHLAGANHSADPRNVMHSPITRPYWRCRAKRADYVEVYL